MSNLNRQERIGTGLAAGSMLLVGGSVAASSLLGGYPVLGGQGIRYLVAGLLLAAWAQLRRKPLPRPAGREWAWLAGLAVIGLAGCSVLLIEATQVSDPASVGVVIGAAPLVIVIAVAVAAGRRPSRRLLLAAAVVTAGSAAAQFGGATGLTWNGTGLLLSVGALGGAAGASLLAAPVLPRLGALAVTIYSCGLAGLLLLAAAAVTRWAGGPPVLRIPTATQFAALSYLAIAVTAVVFIAWYAAMKRLGVDRTGLFNGLIPIASLAAVALVGTGTIRPLQFLAALTVLAGVILGLGRTPKASAGPSWRGAGEAGDGRLADGRREMPPGHVYSMVEPAWIETTGGRNGCIRGPGRAGAWCVYRATRARGRRAGRAADSPDPGAVRWRPAAVRRAAVARRAGDRPGDRHTGRHAHPLPCPSLSPGGTRRPGCSPNDQGGGEDDIPRRGPPVVEALDDGLDGVLGHQRGVLADRGEIDEGQARDLAIVVARDRYIAGNVDAGPDEGVEDAMGASVICREDGGGQLVAGEDVTGGGGAGFLGVVAWENPYLVLEAVSSHGAPVAAPTLSGSGLVAAVDVHDATVAEACQVVNGQPGAVFVGDPHDVDAVPGDAPSDVDDGHLIRDACELCGLDGRPVQDQRLTAVGEQFLHGLPVVAPGPDCAQDNVVAAPFGGRIDRLDQVDVERLPHGEQHADVSAAVAPEYLRRGVRPVAQFSGGAQNTLAGLRAGPRGVAQHQ
jgi:drug/metabolite transporter (DMT)-like permease